MQLPPQTFWAMSLPEWRATLAGRAPKRATPMARAELAALLAAYPDKS